MSRKQAIKKSAIFFIPFLFMIGSICYVGPPPAFSFQYLKNDCSGQAQWIYKSIYSDTQKTSLAFFGSSHTLQGINDSLINSLNTGFYSVNLGYCRFGRDIQYELFRQALTEKKIRLAVFEITETEPSYSHPVYPYLAQGSDVFFPSFVYNQDFYRNRCEAFLYRVAFLRSKFYTIKDTTPPIMPKTFGYITSSGTAGAEFLESQKKEKLKDLADYSSTTVSRKAELSFSDLYFTKIKKLADENNCKVYFLYLPAFGNNANNSLDSLLYKKHFETLVPPDTLLNNYANWQDEAHFNKEGAVKLSAWVVKTLTKIQ